MTEKILENQIEELRDKMYEAYNNDIEYEKVLKLSQELDLLLNELDHLVKQPC